MVRSTHVGALFAGHVDDGGFMEYGYRALLRAQRELGLELTVIDRIEPQPASLADALRRLAGQGCALVVAHGGQNDPAALIVAREFAQTRFAVTQGNVRAANLASYEVRQEQSAFLAGITAALLTRTGIVGHISGIRVRPGLLGRAAYAAGVAAAGMGTRLLTTFCGAQDDPALAGRVARAQIDAGADVIFTMLNAGIGGAIAAGRERGIRLIGNVRDWVADTPDVFVASAIADVGIGVYDACRDHVHGTWQPDRVRRLGLEHPSVLGLSLGAEITGAIRGQIATWHARLVAEAYPVPEHFAGPELAV